MACLEQQGLGGQWLCGSPGALPVVYREMSVGQMGMNEHTEGSRQ